MKVVRFAQKSHKSEQISGIELRDFEKICEISRRRRLFSGRLKKFTMGC